MFDSFRGDFGYSYYGERRTSATVDIPLAAVVYTCVLISIATIVAAAGIRGKARWYTLIRVVYSLGVGSTILLCLFGDCWMEGIDHKVNVPYIYRSDAEISGQVGLNIGLQKINITLKGTFQGANKGSVKYNEAIPFGAVGAITEFRDYLERGLPQPVLTVVEFFSIDVGGMRWGRSFSMAGYVAKILLLTAFSFWILANIMICSVVFYGAALFTLTGISMVTTSIVYHALQPTAKLRFFCSESEFHLHYGICFWAVLLMGIFATIVGLVILLMDTKMPQVVQKFFLIEVLDDTEDMYETQKISVSGAPMYKKNDFRRQSAPSLLNLHMSSSSTDLYKTSTLYSVAEVEGSEITPPIRRSRTNPGNLGNLRNSYSLESLREFPGKHTSSLKNVSRDDQLYKSNPIFAPNENTENVNYELFSKKRISSIPGRLQSTMSLESLPSIPDERGLSFDSGMDNDDDDHIHISDVSTKQQDSDTNSDENIDISMFETTEHSHDIINTNVSSYSEVPRNDNTNTNVSSYSEVPRNDKVFTLDVDNCRGREEERLRGIYIDMSSAYP